MSDRVITYTRDILKEVACKHNIDIEVVKYIYESYVTGLRKIANYTDAGGIEIPYIGTMYINYNFLVNEIALMKDDPKHDVLKLKALEQKQEILAKAIKEYPNKNAKSTRLLHTKKGRLGIDTFTNGKTLTEIEEIQNKINR